LADGLLALHDATGDARWLLHARALTDVLLAHFEDPLGGGFFLTPASADLLVRPKPFEDNALPSGNAVALRVLRALGEKTGSDTYRAAAANTRAAAAPFLHQAPSALPATVAALIGGAGEFRMANLEPEASRLPRSKDHVHGTASLNESDPSRLLVRFTIDEGWHINANPASLTYLVPTTVDVPGAGATAAYPEGKSFRPAFSDEPIQVYEGRLEIPVTLTARPDALLRAILHFQACDETRCLPPDRIAIDLEKPVAPTP
jgi:hypothetical protein